MRMTMTMMPASTPPLFFSDFFSHFLRKSLSHADVPTVSKNRSCLLLELLSFDATHSLTEFFA